MNIPGDDEPAGKGPLRRSLARLRDEAGKPHPPRLSEILEAIAADAERERISVGDLVQAMDGRAFGALLLIFAFPNMLPTPPGTAGILGLPLFYLSIQMMLGRLPWLPAFIARRSVPRETLEMVVARATPWLARAERLLTQRLWLLVSPAAERALGALCLLLAVILVLPIPFGNMLPSLAICILALGILERDGLWVIFGLIASAVAITVVGALGYAVVKSAIFVFVNAF
jgi:hypothetical protein